MGLKMERGCLILCLVTLASFVPLSYSLTNYAISENAVEVTINGYTEEDFTTTSQFLFKSLVAYSVWDLCYKNEISCFGGSYDYQLEFAAEDVLFQGDMIYDYDTDKIWFNVYVVHPEDRNDTILIYEYLVDALQLKLSLFDEVYSQVGFTDVYATLSPDSEGNIEPWLIAFIIILIILLILFAAYLVYILLQKKKRKEQELEVSPNMEHYPRKHPEDDYDSGFL